MKRSDMLVILEEAIINSYDYCSVHGPSYDYDIILQALEEAGMLPPIDSHSFFMDGDNADQNSITYRKWTEENE